MTIPSPPPQRLGLRRLVSAGTLRAVAAVTSVAWDLYPVLGEPLARSHRAGDLVGEGVEPWSGLHILALCMIEGVVGLWIPIKVFSLVVFQDSHVHQSFQKLF